MSADQAQPALKSLQCHFTWDLDRPRPNLLLLGDELLDIGPEEGNRWGGHIYNLRGFIQFKLGLHEDAKSLLSKAAEAFHRMRPADQGPWLVVNYGNMAWLHHLLGDQEQSQVYLSKVGALMKEHPPPSQGELHAEVCAEKAWTLMKFGEEKMQEVSENFEKAVNLKPDMVEWKSSHVLSLVRAQEHRGTGVSPGLLERMRQAKDQDPGNLYLAVLYLEQRAKKGESVRDEVREIARRVLETPVGSYSCMRALLRVYKNHLSIDGYIDLAEKALKRYPDQRYLKTFLVRGYRHKVVSRRGRRQSPDMINRAISLQEEVVSLYPQSSLMKKIDLIDLYVKSFAHLAKVDPIFKELFDANLEQAEKQLLLKAYAKYISVDLRELPRLYWFEGSRNTGGKQLQST